MQDGTWLEIKNKEDIEHLMYEFGVTRDGSLPHVISCEGLPKER